MATEIERKFLVRGDFFPEVYDSKRIVQGYICSSPERSVRVRIRGDEGYLTIKGASNVDGTTRYEFEKKITEEEACQLLALCEPGTISKVRHLVKAGDHIIEVDVFDGENQGLVVAEIELKEASEVFIRPDWLGEEVTGDVRYYNSMLSRHPYSTWENKK